MNTHDLIDQIDVRLAELVNLGRNIHKELQKLNALTVDRDEGSHELLRYRAWAAKLLSLLPRKMRQALESNNVAAIDQLEQLQADGVIVRGVDQMHIKFHGPGFHWTDDLGERFDANEKNWAARQENRQPPPPPSLPPPSADVQAKVRNLLLQALFYLTEEKA